MRMIKNFLNKVDLALTVLLTLLYLLFLSVPLLNETTLRSILGLFLMLLLPGYSLVAMLFPRRDYLDMQIVKPPDPDIIKQYEGFGFGLGVLIKTDENMSESGIGEYRWDWR